MVMAEENAKTAKRPVMYWTTLKRNRTTMEKSVRDEEQNRHMK